MQSYHKIRTVLDKVSKDAIQTLTQDQLDAIGEILAGGVSDAKRINSFCLEGIPEEYHKALLPLSISKRAKLSIAAMRKNSFRFCSRGCAMTRRARQLIWIFMEQTAKWKSSATSSMR